MSHSVYARIAELLSNAQHILLLTDERIDGDTLGSTLGLFHVLVKANKNISVFSPKPLPPMFTFIPGVEHIGRDQNIFTDTTVDLIIVCDNSDGVYLPALLKTMPYKVPVVCIDHHATNPHYGDINLIEPHAPSTADVAYRLVRTLNLPISQSAAQCFLTGMCTDTILFSTQHTNDTVMRLAGELIARGARLKPIVQNTMMNKSMASMKLWGLALSRLSHDPELDATVTGITEKDIQETGATEDDIKSLSEYLNEVLDSSHETVAVYYEKPDGSLKGSLRSRTRDVATLATQKFGGGGHKLAAGFKILNARFQEVKSGMWKPISTAKASEKSTLPTPSLPE
ncbi:MAG: DHH family phosphoesterase [Patescibacteria group bacterium]